MLGMERFVDSVGQFEEVEMVVGSGVRSLEYSDDLGCGNGSDEVQDAWK